MKTTKPTSKASIYKMRTTAGTGWLEATAATAAGVTASQASTITINLVGNYMGFGGAYNLNADLTGDGHPDLTIAQLRVIITPASRQRPASMA